ncbi:MULTISPECIES: hypothetical protein [Wolbachia]|uniref:hypothetical protein n=1 Tax=Wolbachia TaxID=953 RepID=UPI00101AD02C|nr:MULTISPECIES: hypothetical protein [Wolbachia]QBB84281.1 hypothetical protein DEJ70_06205 [Wolbachia pipientis wAlbB]QDW09076.1 hypothetical protein CO539_006170 [Wolbachia pipientis]QDW10275.1 hypothetical protein CO538_006180 [Wolbachia pipientis]QZA83350.1 hypothetical protein K1Y75_06040 [Wolbachia pipientis]
MTINIYIEGTVLKSTKGIHSKSEKKLRVCMEAVWRNGCQRSKIYHNYRNPSCGLEVSEKARKIG